MWGRRSTLVLDDVRVADEVEAPPAVEVRRLRADEGALLRRVRLAAILEAPLGHTVSLNEALAFDDTHWAARARAASAPDRQVWIAVADDPEHPVGIVGGQLMAWAIEVDALWVAPTWRGERRSGHVADQLLHPLVEWAERERLSTDLWVHETNHRAVHYYRRRGFRATGLVKPYPLPPGGHDVQFRLQAGQGLVRFEEAQAASGK